MNFKNHTSLLSKSLLILAALISFATAEQINTPDKKPTDAVRNNFNEDLKLIEKMRAIYISQGDQEAVDALTDEIRAIKDSFFRLNELSNIQISSSTDVSIHTLRKNTARLSGDYRPTFSFVSDAINGAQFTRTPWRSKPSYEITALSSGYVYLLGVSSHSFDDTDSNLTVIEDTISGKYIGKCYKVFLYKGQKYACSGYETCLISRSIIVDNE